MHLGLLESCLLHPNTSYYDGTGPLELQEVIAIAIEMLEGLEQLHALHILHLDLKPGNVLLDQHGHAYLADFGISHALRTLEACTAMTSGSSSGTPHYMCVPLPPACSVLCSSNGCAVSVKNTLIPSQDHI